MMVANDGVATGRSLPNDGVAQAESTGRVAIELKRDGVAIRKTPRRECPDVIGHFARSGGTTVSRLLPGVTIHVGESVWR